MEWWWSGFVIVQSLYNIYYGNRLVPDWTLVKCLAYVMLACKKGKKVQRAPKADRFDGWWCCTQ